MERDYYVETSVWGMIPKGQPREMRRASLQFLRRFPGSSYHVSSVVLREIAACRETDREQIMEVLEATSPALLELTQEAEELAQFYIASGILSHKKKEDALHVAIATVQQLDVLVSWNHRHIANIRKTEQYRGANLIRGYAHTPYLDPLGGAL